MPALSRDGLLLGRYVETGLIILLLRMFQGGPSIIRRGCRGMGGSECGLVLAETCRATTACAVRGQLTGCFLSRLLSGRNVGGPILRLGVGFTLIGGCNVGV